MNFPRPRHPQPAPPVQAPLPSRISPAPSSHHPTPDLIGSVVALVGLGLTALLAAGDTPSNLARSACIGVLVSVGASMAFDWRRGGLPNLVRADLMAILALFFLTLFEFIFPQPNFDALNDVGSTRRAIICVLVAFAGLFIGRHFLHARRQPFANVLTREIPPAWIVLIFWACVFIGYAHMLIAVRFDVVEMVSAFMDARFSQPWQRGRLGDWKALLVELGLFLYLVPPLGGIMIAHRHRYGKLTLTLICAALGFTLFYGFTSGTRNMFAAYLVTFLIGYTFALPAARRKERLSVYVGCAVLMIAASFFMLEFRTVGLRSYLQGDREPLFAHDRTYFVDYNLYTIARLVEIFPEEHDFLGWETPYQALIRPIPRAIWPGKPEGLSVSMEEALGVEGLTLGASFAGEAYVCGGLLVVLLAGVGLGALTGWWNHLVSPHNSELGMLIYASGFFAAVISMRSLFTFTTALLPTAAALIISAYAVRTLTIQTRRLLSSVGARRRPAPQRRPLRPPRR